MKKWFTVEKISDDTFVISEYGHWEETHCYLLCGTKRALLIDTGLGVSNIKSVTDELTALPIQVVTTHAHWDHIGGHKYFENIAVHESEKEWLRGKFPIPLQVVKRNLTCESCDFPKEFELDKYEIFSGNPIGILQDGEIIDLGERQIMVIHTPGHSPGHCCFYEKNRKTLYSGDLIYKGCLYAFYPTTDPQLFYQSVKKVRKLEISRVFPGHHQLDISVGIIKEIENAFASLDKAGKLAQGQGVFDFGEFQIQI